jgi:hypothetical protein
MKEKQEATAECERMLAVRCPGGNSLVPANPTRKVIRINANNSSLQFIHQYVRCIYSSSSIIMPRLVRLQSTVHRVV